MSISYPHRVPQQHKQGCWRWSSHWRCAVALVAKLAAVLEAVSDEHELSESEQAKVDELLAEVDAKGGTDGR